MQIQEARKLTAGASIGFRDLINTKTFAATVTSVDPLTTIVVGVPNNTGRTSFTWPLHQYVDEQIDLPIFALA
jgi:hypothetical protein